MDSLSRSRRALLASLIAALPSAALAQGSMFDTGRGMLGKVPGGLLPGGQNQSEGGGRGNLGAGLSDGEIGSGLKQALQVASRRVVGRVGRPGGYEDDPAIRIPLPGPLERVRGGLQAVGAGGMLDDLQRRMNHAAETAAPKALDIFVDAAGNMSIDDARGILTGPPDAATQYFRRTTSGQLTTAFHPIVSDALSGAGAMGVFRSVQDRASGIPFAGDQVRRFDLVDYTVGKALDGLFHYLGVEEASIRSNPAARSTDLLRRVFG